MTTSNRGIALHSSLILSLAIGIMLVLWEMSGLYGDAKNNMIEWWDPSTVSRLYRIGAEFIGTLVVCLVADPKKVLAAMLKKVGWDGILPDDGSQSPPSAMPPTSTTQP